MKSESGKNILTDELPHQIFVNGLGVYNFQSRQQLIDMIQDRHRILIAVNSEKILKVDSRFQTIVNQNIGYPDGIGAVLSLKRKGYRAIKIPGAYLWLDIINAFYDSKSIYLLGATEDVIGKTVEKLRDDFPGINIVNYRNGYFNQDEFIQIKDDILQKKPDIVFVALGSPKQEFIMDELIKKHSALYMGLGGSFDLYTGKAKPVPEWWNKYFLYEGLYRSLSDLRNIKRWKRNLNVLRIIPKIVFNKL